MTDHPDLRAADADRQRVVDALRRHLGDGRLELDEFEDRAARAFAAKTMGDLTPLLSDLPAVRERTSGPPARVRPPRSPGASAAWDVGYRIHLYLWLLLSVFWIIIWLFTGAGFFWPVFPIAGVGLSVGVHAAVRKAVLG